MVVAQILIGLLIAISAYFLKRLIDDNDKSHEKQSKAINSNTLEMRKLSTNLTGLYNQFLEVERVVKESDGGVENLVKDAEKKIDRLRRDLGEAIVMSREDVLDSIRALEKESMGRVVILEDRHEKLISALKKIADKGKKSA